MIKKILSRVAPSPEKFIEELFSKDINESNLKVMLESKKFTINHIDDNGNSFLHLCVIANKYQGVKWLLDNGISVLNIKNKFEKDVFEIAIEKGNHLIVNILLATNKIDINRVDNDERTLLQNAVIAGNKKVAKELIARGIDVNSVDSKQRNVIFDAIAFGDEELINDILGVENLNLNQCDYIGETVLHQKAVLENDHLAQKLLENGADPTICDAHGKNFLYHCSTKGTESSQKLLKIAIKNGANLNIKMKNNNSLLMETMSVFYQLPASEKERRDAILKMAEILVVEGIDVHAINDDGESGLFDAVRNNQYDICAFFLNQKINPNQINNKYETPLLLAVLQGIEALDIILLLLKNKANPNLRNAQKQNIIGTLNELVLHTRGFRTLHDMELANHAKHEKQFFRILKEILIHSQHDLTGLNTQGIPHFFLPMLCGDYDLFLLYIQNKFDINQCDNDGHNIFYRYVKYIFDKNIYDSEFKKYIIRMIYYKVNMSQKDKDGKLIFSSILHKNMNLELYKDLLEVCYFPYESKDKSGRTIMHYAVMAQNLEAVEHIYEKNNDVVNVADNAGILPLAYAALFGLFDIVKSLLAHGNVHIRSRRGIHPMVKEKFLPMVAKLDSLKERTNNPDLLRKLGILIDQIKKDFKVE